MCVILSFPLRVLSPNIPDPPLILREGFAFRCTAGRVLVSSLTSASCQMAAVLSSRVDDDSKPALHKRGRKKIQNIFLQPYQCSESRNTESPLQGVRGGESFRVIRSSGIPYPFWFLGALPNANFLVSISFSITLGIQDQIDITIFHIFVSSWCIFVFSRSFTEYYRSAAHTSRGIFVPLHSWLSPCFFIDVSGLSDGCGII